MNKNRQLYSTLGLCIRCGKTRDGKHVRCSDCHALHLQYSHNRRSKANNNGNCLDCCIRPSLPEGKYCARCQDMRVIYQKDYHRSVRLEVIAAYGGCCICCGVSSHKYLELDHVNNDGAQHRKELGGGGKEIFRWAKKHGFPSTLQLLCGNCHNAKRYGGCSEEDHPLFR